MTEDSLHGHVGIDFGFLQATIRKLVVGESDTVSELVSRLDDLLSDVQTQTYDEEAVTSIEYLLEELDQEVAHDDLDAETAQDVKEIVLSGLDAYRTATLNKSKHPENQ